MFHRCIKLYSYRYTDIMPGIDLSGMCIAEHDGHIVEACNESGIGLV